MCKPVHVFSLCVRQCYIAFTDDVMPVTSTVCHISDLAVMLGHEDERPPVRH